MKKRFNQSETVLELANTQENRGNQ